MIRTPTRENLHGHRRSYEKLKGMVLQREYIERERGKIPTISMWPCSVTSLIENLLPMKRLQEIKNGRIL